MNMTSFDRSVWLLHRKLHHRFLKIQDYFVRAGELLPEYRRRRDSPRAASSASASVSGSQDVICLLSDSTGTGDDDTHTDEDE